MFLSKKFCAALALASIALSPVAKAGVLYSNGFETDTSGWNNVTRVASGTDGITSASGNYHATVGTDGNTNYYTSWGGYNFGAGSGVPTAFQDYATSVDVYLNVNGGLANDTRFDWDSAISNSSGTFLRDFIFNAGFYNDASGPGAGTNRFVISTGNNSQPGSAYAKNAGHDPIAIENSGWYTFEHHFMDVGGFLSVDMSIFDSGGSLVHSWTIGGTDAIAGVGGSRYGWFDYNQVSPLAIDNTSLTVTDQAVPEPADLALFGLGLLGLALANRKRRKS